MIGGVASQALPLALWQLAGIIRQRERCNLQTDITETSRKPALLGEVELPDHFVTERQLHGLSRQLNEEDFGKHRPDHQARDQGENGGADDCFGKR